MHFAYARCAMRLALLLRILCAAVLFASAGPAHAQLAPAAAKSAPEEKDKVEEPAEPTVKPRSPRAAVQRFQDLSRQGRFAEAAAFLDVPASREADRSLLARRLRAVLDRYLWLDLDKISEQTQGNLTDGLPARYEQLGTIAIPRGPSHPVRLARRLNGETWAFSASTVGQIDTWYASLPDRWLREHLPEPLLRVGPRELLWWQWSGLLLITLASTLLGMLAGAIVRRVANRLASRTVNSWDNRILSRSRGPLALGFGIGFVRALVPFLLLYQPAETFVFQVLRAVFLANVLWAVWRLVDVIAEISWSSPWSFDHPGSRALIPLARRVGKALVAVAAILLLVSALGYPITSLIAGLGIGGLALALASQKTVENLFGAFSLGIDQPFREGDFVRVDDLLGTVESLGLRSTRIRTLERTLVSIPNGKLAEMRLETFAARDRLRLFCVLGLVHGTTSEQLRTVLHDIEQALREHPKIHPEGLSVRLIELGASALNIEISCWFSTSDGNEFTLIRQDMLLTFLGIIERAGTKLAFPTQTVLLKGEPPAPARPDARAAE